MYLPVGARRVESRSSAGRCTEYIGDAKTSKVKVKDLYTNMFWKALTGGYAPLLADIE
jgi:hypothetical protein